VVPSHVPDAVTESRRGYRAEVKAWMADEQIETIGDAAKKLGVSETTLKSIMSDVGEVRYGKDTLERVLRMIQATEG
jgi:hypothetical protein